MTTTPITFACTQVIPKTTVEICAEIANLSRWPEFSGYGLLPGIKSSRIGRLRQTRAGRE